MHRHFDLRRGERALFGLLFHALKIDRNLQRLILVGGLGRTLQFAAIVAGVAGRPELGFFPFDDAGHAPENKSENKKFKKLRFF